MNEVEVYLGTFGLEIRAKFPQVQNWYLLVMETENIQGGEEGQGQNYVISTVRKKATTEWSEVTKENQAGMWHSN